MTDEGNAAPAGRVLGTSDATPLSYSFVLEEHGHVQLDDVVTTERELPNRQKVTLSGVVTQVRAHHEGARFDSDVFLIQEGVLPTDVRRAVLKRTRMSQVSERKLGRQVAAHLVDRTTSRSPRFAYMARLGFR